MSEICFFTYNVLPFAWVNFLWNYFYRQAARPIKFSTQTTSKTQSLGSANWNIKPCDSMSILFVVWRYQFQHDIVQRWICVVWRVQMKISTTHTNSTITQHFYVAHHNQSKQHLQHSHLKMKQTSHFTVFCGFRQKPVQKYNDNSKIYEWVCDPVQLCKVSFLRWLVFE